MRRMFFALAILGLAAAAPLLARGDDNEIARQIITKLKVEKAAGHLQGFDIDLKVEDGVVWLRGRVASPQQEQMVLETARLTPGVVRVMKNIQMGGEAQPAVAAPSRRTQDSVAASSQAMKPAQVAASPQTSSRRNPQEESKLQLLTGPAKAQPISLEPTPAPAPAVDRQSIHLVAVTSPAEPSPSSVATVSHTAGFSDQEVAQDLGRRLKQSMAAGRLAGHNLAFKVENGVVWLRGSVASYEQEQLVLSTARATPGVTKIMKNLEIGSAQLATSNDVRPIPAEAGTSSRVQAAANQTTAAPAALQKAGPAQPQLVPANPYYGHPYAGYYPAPNQAPVAFAPAQPASAEIADSTNAAAAGAAGGPGMAPYAPTAPVSPAAFGGAGVRYDHPYLPSYAWPTYAAYPNYAAVTYPKTYSPTVWPYIGPFYPYPQVPLGWRKVTLEWDDGWWQLDFKDQSRPWKMR